MLFLPAFATFKICCYDTFLFCPYSDRLVGRRRIVRTRRERGRCAAAAARQALPDPAKRASAVRFRGRERGAGVLHQRGVEHHPRAAGGQGGQSRRRGQSRGWGQPRRRGRIRPGDRAGRNRCGRLVRGRPGVGGRRRKHCGDGERAAQRSLRRPCRHARYRHCVARKADRRYPAQEKRHPAGWQPRRNRRSGTDACRRGALQRSFTRSKSARAGSGSTSFLHPAPES